jgi:hypothetical protein
MAGFALKMAVLPDAKKLQWSGRRSFVWLSPARWSGGVVVVFE